VFDMKIMTNDLHLFCKTVIDDLRCFYETVTYDLRFFLISCRMTYGRDE
jgi:hypothetical protein